MTTKFQSVIDAFIESYSIDPYGIYCLVTGKRIGITDFEELQCLIDSLPDDDPESCADDLALRLFASMRPSMRWNKMRTDSLDKMRKLAPHETMAYLLNRLFTTIERSQSYVIEHGERIELFAHITKFFDSDSPLFSRALEMLLSIDARLHLSKESCSFTARKLMDTCQTLESLIDLLTPWHETALAKYERQLASDRFMQSNPLARQAFFNSFMESRPISATRATKNRRQQRHDSLNDLFDAVIGSSRVETLTKIIAAQPAPSPAKLTTASTKMPMRFGVKQREIES